MASCFALNAQANLFGNGSAGDLTIHVGQVDSTINSYYSVIAVNHDTITLSRPLPLSGNQTVLVFFSNPYQQYTGFAHLQYTYSATNNYKVPDYVYGHPDSLRKIQMLLVPQYRKLIIDTAALVTCPAYNDSVGGHLVFLVKDTFIINGQIDLTAKGFKPNNTLPHGLGGAGGTGGAGGIIGADGGNHGTIFFSGIGGGGNGGTQGEQGTFKVDTCFFCTYNNSAYWSPDDIILTMGGSGRNGASRGGTGAGGGGGGAGSLACDSGTAGGVGGNGGYGGRGGIGGGACLFYAKKIFCDTSLHFISAGTSAVSGIAGADGGNGGNGGNGCGTCINGGPGGGGGGGNGGNGGNGGDGGVGGTFFYVSDIGQPSLPASVFNINGGLGGQGGIGGHAGLPGINGISIIDTICVLHSCGNGGYTCGCDWEPILDTLVSMSPSHNNDGSVSTDSSGVLHFTNPYNDITLTHDSNGVSFLNDIPVSPNTNCRFGILNNNHLPLMLDSCFKTSFLNSFHWNLISSDMGEIYYSGIGGFEISCNRGLPNAGIDGLQGDPGQDGGGGGGGTVLNYTPDCSAYFYPYTEVQEYYDECGELFQIETFVDYGYTSTDSIELFGVNTGGVYTVYSSSINGFGLICDQNHHTYGYNDLYSGLFCMGVDTFIECAPDMVMPSSSCANDGQVSFFYTGCEYGLYVSSVTVMGSGLVVSSYDEYYISPHVITIADLPAEYLEITFTDQNTGDQYTDYAYLYIEPMDGDIYQWDYISCNGASDASLEVDMYNSGSFTYEWNPSSAGSGYFANNLSAGYYTVTVYDANNCSITFEAEINEPPPVVVDIFTPYNMHICQGESAQICVTLGLASYEWSDGQSGSDCITTQTAGVYNVTVTDNNICTAISDHVVVNVYPLPIVSLTASQTIFCSGDSATVCATSGFSSYLWNMGQTSNCIYPSSSGTYYVTITDANNCTAVSNHLALSVYPLSSVSVSVNGNVLTAFNALTYQWYFNDTLISGANSSTYTATQSGSYSLQATDTNGCQTFSNVVSVVVSGIATMVNGQSSILVYPNPFSNELSVVIQKQNIKQAGFIITNVLGQQLYKKEETNLSNYYTKQLDLSKLASGVYFVEINIDGEKTVKQVVKQ